MILGKPDFHAFLFHSHVKSQARQKSNCGSVGHSCCAQSVSVAFMLESEVKTSATTPLHHHSDEPEKG
eukprot:765978-Hanusia_phi.AAC.2